MKRFLILLLAVLLTVGTFACGGRQNEDKTTPEQPVGETTPDAAPAAETPAPVSEPEVTETPAPAFTPGEYGLTGYRVGDYTFSGEQLIQTGIADTTLTLNADYSGMLIIMAQEMPIGWNDAGEITVSGVPYSSIVRTDAGAIEFSYGDAVLIFEPGAKATASAEADPTEAPAETAAPVETEAPAPQGEAAFPGAPYGSSDGVIDRAMLAGLYRWLGEMPNSFCYALTFDEISAAVGKQGNDDQNNDGKTQSATWWDAENDSLTVTFKDQGDGTYACSAFAISGIQSKEYSVADISGFPKVASSTPAGTNPTETQTFEAKVGFSGPKVNVTAQIPNKNWQPKASSGSVYIYCAPNAKKADSSFSYFKIECKESLDKIDFYKDSFENLTELAPRTIGGIEMQGRSYKNVGMDWIEYYGEIAEGVWVSIKLTGVDLSEGTETEAILMNFTFAVQ